MRSKTLLAVLAAGLFCSGLFIQQAQATLVTGSITFSGTVQLDTASAGTATKVTAWGGLAGGKPQVESRDGSFTAFTTPGDAVTFFAPWSFNSGPIASFWMVGGFTFDLSSSAKTFQNASSVNADGTGTISGNGFMATAGTWHFTTQDPSTGSPATFSFSAATGAVPDGGSSVALLGVGLAGIEALRRRIYARKA